MSKVIRTVKNVTKGYSATQVKVRNATSNDPWGPTGTEMSEIARMTFDTNHDFFEVMEMLDRRLNDKGKNWRHVLKALKVLDYCLHEGSAHVVVWAKDNIYIIKTLREFQYVDEEGKDQGINVRTAAKELTSLILDEERLRKERSDRKLWKSRVGGLEEGISSESASREPPRRRQQRPGGRTEDEDLEYRLALEASKNLAEEEAAKRKSKPVEVDDDDLEKAIRLSKEEEEQRQRELEQANENTLFDDTPTPTQTHPSQGFNQSGFGQQPWGQNGNDDFFGTQQLPQNTGYLNTVYSQPGFGQDQFGQQPTGYVQGRVATGWDVQPPFPTPAGFDQHGQQPQQQQQNLYQIQPQQTAVNNGNPYSAEAFGVQGTGFLQPGNNNPYGNSGLQPNAEALKPTPTGSNNPFAQFATQPSTQNSSFSNNFNSISPQRTAQPSLVQLQQQQQQQQQQRQNTNFASSFQQNNPVDAKHAHLNALLATGNESGQDTFGNVGNLRIPAQHTAPGTFINSAGSGRTGLAPAATGNNPFLGTQFTGVPQQQFGSLAQQRGILPAQTGPAGINGYGQANPYGGAFGGQQQFPSQQQQSSNLIDL